MGRETLGLVPKRNSSSLDFRSLMTVGLLAKYILTMFSKSFLGFSFFLSSSWASDLFIIIV